MNKPILMWLPKLSNIECGWNLDGWPVGTYHAVVILSFRIMGSYPIRDIDISVGKFCVKLSQSQISLFLDLQDGGGIFLRNVSWLKKSPMQFR
jgi:hypothetical protein